MLKFEGLCRDQVTGILQKISGLKLGVVGDACLDLYWDADMGLSELSRETPHHNVPVVKERFSLGAAGNVAANLKALGCAEVNLCSVTGNDWRGMLLENVMNRLGISSAYLVEAAGRFTPAYCKTIRYGLQGISQETARIDFVNTTPLPKKISLLLFERLDHMAQRVDAIVVTDQLANGVISDTIRSRLQYWAKQGKVIVIDSRNNIGLFSEAVVKPNEVEALKWYQSQYGEHSADNLELAQVGLLLSSHVRGPCCLTMGDKGALWIEGGLVTMVPVHPAPPPIDIVGAGDSYASSLLAALAAGFSGPVAAAFAHLSSYVTVRKVGETGTANPAEIVAAYDEIRRKEA